VFSFIFGIADLIGVTRVYDPVIDKPVRTASMALMRGAKINYTNNIPKLRFWDFKHII
jgi:hypothetical protein